MVPKWPDIMADMVIAKCAKKVAEYIFPYLHLVW